MHAHHQTYLAFWQAIAPLYDPCHCFLLWALRFLRLCTYKGISSPIIHVTNISFLCHTLLIASYALPRTQAYARNTVDNPFCTLLVWTSMHWSHGHLHCFTLSSSLSSLWHDSSSNEVKYDEHCLMNDIHILYSSSCSYKLWRTYKV